VCVRTTRVLWTEGTTADGASGRTLARGCVCEPPEFYGQMDRMDRMDFMDLERQLNAGGTAEVSLVAPVHCVCLSPLFVHVPSVQSGP